MNELLRSPIEDPAAWRGCDMLHANDWSVELDADAVAEIDHALERVSTRNLPLYDVAKDDFLLPNVSKLLTRVLGDIEGGRGFVRLRGLPVGRWGEERSRLALWGLGAHLGWAEAQDGAGSLMHDVRDIGRKFGSNDTIRYFQTSQAIEFHNDGADMFALACLATGNSGGRSRLISAVEVFNEIARRNEELAVVLQNDFHFDARGQRTDGARCQIHPIYSHYAGKVNVLLKTAYIHSAQRFDDVPRLTDKQTEALALLQSVLNEPDLALEFDFAPGDVLMASNHVVLHGRTAYTDAPDEGGPRRHMLRLWLTIPNGRPLPAHYADTREFARTYARRIATSAIAL